MKRQLYQTDELTAALYGPVEDEVPLETWLRRNAELQAHLEQEAQDALDAESEDPADIVERKLDGNYEH